MSEETFMQALALAGVQGGRLPDKMAAINGLLDALPPQAREAAIIAVRQRPLHACLGRAGGVGVDRSRCPAASAGPVKPVRACSVR